VKAFSSTLALAVVLLVASAACGGGRGCRGNTVTSWPDVPAREHVEHVVVPAELRTLLDAPDREGDDKQLDAGRHPLEMLAFFEIKPAMRVGEIATADGYTGELLARAVAPGGIVYAQNNEWLVDKFGKDRWPARLSRPANKNVVKVVRDFDDPFPPEAKDLDAVVCVLNYHDFVWLRVDRAKMNAAVFRALKPGGVYGIVDHSGRTGTGISEVKTLHRIEEKVVRAEIAAAGFELAADAAFLRNPDDKRDWNTVPGPTYAGARRGTSDRFVLKFVKPAK
jgi:predicted methyltransferase